MHLTGNQTFTAAFEALPPDEAHERAVSLDARLARANPSRLVLSGVVSVTDGYDACASDQKAVLKRRKNGAWRTLKKTTTDGAGSYAFRLADRKGRFKAVAPEVMLSQGPRRIDCLRAESSSKRHPT